MGNNPQSTTGPGAAIGEFDLIARWFTRPARRSPLGVGDDCALLQVAAGHQLAVSTDMLVEGRHFLPTVAADALGHKALAVNLSDLAACGARPLAFTLALALPRVDEHFLSGFSEGLWTLALQHQIDLVGGDTTAGPLNLCITVMGEVPSGQALLRSGGRAGDELWISGTLGAARLALEAFRGRVALSATDFTAARQAMERPQPRVALGMALRGIATAAIDLSDGLVGDLGHVMSRSGLGARIRWAALPASRLLAGHDTALQHECLLAGGDDYELLFAAPPDRHQQVLQAAQTAHTPVTCVGELVRQAGLQVLDAEGRAMDWRAHRAFDHFASP